MQNAKAVRVNFFFSSYPPYAMYAGWGIFLPTEEEDEVNAQPHSDKGCGSSVSSVYSSYVPKSSRHRSPLSCTNYVQLVINVPYLRQGLLVL